MYTGRHVMHRLFLSEVNEDQFSRQIFEIRSNIKFHENQTSGSQAAMWTDGQTDRHDEADIHFSQFSDRA